MLSAHGLTCERGERLLFRNLDFELGAGEALLVRGGNGRGKTSLLRILCGLSAPAAGEVRWRGEAIARARERYGREMTYVGHANGIKDDLTPLENLRLAAALGGRALGEDAAKAALARVGLARCIDLPARVLSFGQRRRVALAGLATAGAHLWILDEPLAGLDVDGVAMVEAMIGEHVRAGGLAIMTTHQALRLEGLIPQTLSVGD
ncbi:MAG: cytochrome c biogenesis heme-transporting ATPase CcmA [Thiobacillus sp.]|uniref:cytochrome c biogenesis heme-transporting ATPase CcmA n=1 Tax=Thiobacillus sp. TaxID=924 RepID=UPI002893D6ED|nr:cytochrome c biogenesis heme-transporting ATPase CcmA [Thiobacillus sp.]MDT3705507.1 cytochrome c biogenesis heme-transporting ATPase CcmA [Thiobacillus sp.]